MQPRDFIKMMEFISGKFGYLTKEELGIIAKVQPSAKCLLRLRVTEHGVKKNLSDTSILVAAESVQIVINKMIAKNSDGHSDFYTRDVILKEFN